MNGKRLQSLVLALVLGFAVWIFRFFVDDAVNWIGVDAGEDATIVIRRFVNGGSWLCVAWLCCVLIDLFVWQGMVERRTGQPAPRLIVALVRLLVFLVFIALVAVYVFDKTITALIVSSGAVGIVIGFALQRTINDFFSGVALNVEGPFKVGHWIELDGTAGRVVERTWRAVHLVTLDNVSVIVPNSVLSERQFLNYNMPDRPIRTHLPVALEYAVPVPDAKRMLLAAVRAASGVLHAPSPDVLVTAFGDDGVEYQVRFYVHSYPDMNIATDAVAASISRHMWQAGIGVPYPKRDVYFAQMPARHLDRRTDRESLLARTDLFESLEAAEIQSLGSALRQRRVDAGTDVVRQGEEGNSLFVVVDGLFEVRQESNGLCRAVARLEPGQCFGEMSLLSGEPRSATVTALTEGTLFELASAGLSPVMQRRPEIAETLSRILVERQDRNRQDAPSESLATARSTPRRAAELVRRIRLFFSLQAGP